MKIDGYKKVSYKELQTVLQKRYSEAKIPDVNLAVELGVKSIATVKNTLNMDAQVVSDEVLTKMFKSLTMQAFTLWLNGERNYYLAKN